MRAIVVGRFQSTTLGRLTTGGFCWERYVNWLPRLPDQRGPQVRNQMGAQPVARPVPAASSASAASSSTSLDVLGLYSLSLRLVVASRFSRGSEKLLSNQHYGVWYHMAPVEVVGMRTLEVVHARNFCATCWIHWKFAKVGTNCAAYRPNCFCGTVQTHSVFDKFTQIPIDHRTNI